MEDAMITITIKTENAAFQDGNRTAEVARILHKMAVELSTADRFQFAKVYDINGNSVGTVHLTGKDRVL
jgi:hypothetical protein